MLKQRIVRLLKEVDKGINTLIDYIDLDLKEETGIKRLEPLEPLKFSTLETLVRNYATRTRSDKYFSKRIGEKHGRTGYSRSRSFGRIRQ